MLYLAPQKATIAASRQEFKFWCHKKMGARIAMILLLVVLISHAIEGKPFRNIHLKMWIYDKFSSSNATRVQVGGPNGETNTTKMGSLYVIDNQILDGPDLKAAKEIGRAKGISMIAAVNADHTFFVFSAVLQTSKFSGTISFQGTDKSVSRHGAKHIAVVGGTGDFRNAFGHAIYTITYQNGLDNVALFDTQLVIPPDSSYHAPFTMVAQEEPRLF